MSESSSWKKFCVAEVFSNKTWLVVCLNMDEYGNRQAEIVRAIAVIKDYYTGSFDQLEAACR